MNQGKMGSWISVNYFAWGTQIYRVPNLENSAQENGLGKKLPPQAILKYKIKFV